MVAVILPSVMSISSNSHQKKLNNLIKIADAGLLKVETRKDAFGDDSIFALSDTSGNKLCEIRLPNSLLKEVEIKTGLKPKAVLTDEDIKLIEKTCSIVLLRIGSHIHIEGSENLSRYVDSLEHQTPYNQIAGLPDANVDLGRLKAEIHGNLPGLSS